MECLSPWVALLPPGLRKPSLQWQPQRLPLPLFPAGWGRRPVKGWGLSPIYSPFPPDPPSELRWMVPHQSLCSCLSFSLSPHWESIPARLCSLISTLSLITAPRLSWCCAWEVSTLLQHPKVRMNWKPSQSWWELFSELVRPFLETQTNTFTLTPYPTPLPISFSLSIHHPTAALPSLAHRHWWGGAGPMVPVCRNSLNGLSPQES